MGVEFFFKFNQLASFLKSNAYASVKASAGMLRQPEKRRRAVAELSPFKKNVVFLWYRIIS